MGTTKKVNHPMTVSQEDIVYKIYIGIKVPLVVEKLLYFFLILKT